MANAITKPPKEEWPTFILDLQGPRWTIKKFADCEKDFWDPAVGWKYSAISYGWGYWHDKGEPKATRTTFQWHDSTKELDYPAFDPSISTTWKFPVMNKNYTAPFSFQDPIDPIFTIQDVKKTLTALGTRFVWWDWACVPQGEEKALKATPLPNPDLKPAPQTLEELQTVEVDKMRTVYKCSLNGCLWLHQTTWVRDNKAIKGPVQLLLEYIISVRTATLPKLTVDAVEALYGLLVAAQNSQNSLTSVWSFQEGILFSDAKRPQVLGSSTCMILDHNAETLTKGADGLVGGYGDYVLDIVGVATKIFEITTTALDCKATSRSLPTTASPFERWVYTEESRSRDLLSRLIATGFIGYINDNPMSLFESKFTRTLKSPWSSEADRTCRGILGAFNVDIDNATLLRSRAEKETAKNNLEKQVPQPPSWQIYKAGDVAECAVLKPAFLRALVQGYQWRLLLHARGKESLPAAGTAPTTSWWPKFTEIKRPPFASLEYYIGPTKLFDLYSPRQARPTTVPANVYDMPALEIHATKPEQPLVVKSKPAYKYYDLSKPTTKGWADAAGFYEYKKATPPQLPQDLEDMAGLPHQPGTVSLALVPFKPKTAQDPDVKKDKMGESLLLLPFEKTPAPMGLAMLVTKTKYRCFVLSDFDAVKRTANFRGVGDFSDLNDADLVSLDKDLEIW